MKLTIMILIISTIINILPIVASTDILTKSESLNINQTLISEGGKFELGFFTKGNPKKYYLGIWYKDIPSQNVIVWVANRNSPAWKDTTLLMLSNTSNLVILDGGSHIAWQSNVSNAVDPVLQLLDSGNLVLREAGETNPDSYIWESFEHPTDTLIPGQKLGWNLKTGKDLFLSSWRGADDPGTGNFTLKIEYPGDPEFYLRNGDQIIYRSGPWVGQRFSGVPEMTWNTPDFNFTFYIGSDYIHYMFELSPPNKIKSRLMVTSDGFIQRLMWIPSSNQWSLFWYARKDQCDYYRVCGQFGVCNASALFVCQCPQGFKPENPYAWELRDGSSGCSRNTKLDCESDVFLRMDNMKLPETTTAYVDAGLDLNQCRDLCKKNCSCTAYANSEFINGVGSGCVIWTVDLMDMRDYVVGGQTLYMRLAASDLGSSVSTSTGVERKRKIHMGVHICIAAVIVLAGLLALIIWMRRKTRNAHIGRNLQRSSRGHTTERSQETLLSGQIITRKRENSDEAKNADDIELPLYDRYSMAVATDNFSDANKLGQGGFGRVYKGVLQDGQVVAVKRLSKESGQGAEEFKNEVRLIAKLQHRNLVRLLGCCFELDEKMLIYEYLKNRSLDSILFYKNRSALLNWQTRFNIICGIARGLLYLHQDSRYRIIHRDLKASNILLDADMTPKISDFGMARIFGGDETEGNTRKVVGTYGYLAPEYAMDGLFSIKSDVFSFGVLVLEIISGTKNRGFYNSDNELNLLGYSWKLWREGRGTEMVDKSIGEQYSIQEVLRCLQVGLLCVQERAEDRPNMGSVVLMLSSESACLPQPKLPGFCMPNGTDSSSSNKQDKSFTTNQLTVTMLSAR